MNLEELRPDDCYRAGGVREFDRDSLAGLRKSLNHCHTVNQVLIRENGKLREQIITVNRKVDRQGIKLWVYRLVVGGATVVMTILANSLLECLNR